MIVFPLVVLSLFRVPLPHISLSCSKLQKRRFWMLRSTSIRGSRPSFSCSVVSTWFLFSWSQFVCGWLSNRRTGTSSYGDARTHRKKKGCKTWCKLTRRLGFTHEFCIKTNLKFKNFFIRRKVVSSTMFMYAQSAIFKVCTAFLVQESWTKGKKSRKKWTFWWTISSHIKTGNNR